jgi:hypothetical protein
MSTWTIVLLVIIAILCVVLIVLYHYGQKMQKQQAEQQEMMEAAKQTVSILVIDKKMLRVKDAGLPKEVYEQTPWYAKRSKLPVVKAKVGPKIMNLIADMKVYQQLPLKTECKVVVSGMYISEIKSARGGLNPVKQPTGFRAWLGRRLGRAASRAQEDYNQKTGTNRKKRS